MLRFSLPTGLVVLVLVAAGDVASTQAPRPMMPRDVVGTAPTGTGRIRGRVTSAETRSPLRRAQVSITSPEVSLRRMTTTDAEGRYEFAELPAGRFVITANKGGYVTLQAGQRRPFEPGNPITLGDGQMLTDIDIALPRGSVITGRITDEFGEPIAMAQVQAQRYQYGPGGQRRLTFSGGVGGPLVFTDDLGQFRLYGLMPGEYVVSAVVRQMALAVGPGSANDSTEGFAPTFYPGTINVADAEPVTLGLGQELTLHIPLSAARMARVSGAVLDSEGKPAVGAMVMLRSGSGSGGMMAMVAGQVGPNGTFTLSNVPPGEHFVDIRPTPRGGGSGAEFASVPITVANENIAGLRITTGLGGTVKGRVVFEGTAPQTGGFGPLRVMAQADDPQMPMFGMGMMFGGGRMADGSIADDGAFELGGVTGSVLFRVNAPPSWALKSVTVQGEDMTDVPYEFKGAQALSDVVIVLTDKLTELSGSVTDTRGRAVTDYVVVLLPGEAKQGAAAMRFTRTIRPDQEGAYRVRGLPPGEYLVAAVEALEQGGEWDPEFQGRVRDLGRSVTLREGQSLALDLKLTGGL
jgi:carboxypeptidase family protein